jgi:general secretion pathway protein D
MCSVTCGLPIASKIMMLKHLRVIAGVAAILAAAGLLDARTRKGDKILKQAEAAAAKQDWDHAVDLYQQAIDEDPKDSAYLIGMRKARFEAGQMHVDKARKLRSEGKVEEALAEFQKAIIIDPSSPIALQELKRTQGMLNQPGSADNRGLTPAEQLRKEDGDKYALMQGPPTLKPSMQRIPAIQINNQPVRRLYETVGKIANINVVMDPAGGFSVTGNRDVNLSDSTVEQAFDYLALLTHTYWKPMSSNTIFVTEESTNKRRDYEDWIVQTFYITNATTAQEFVEIQTAVRSIANLRQVFQYNAQKALVVRGSVDAVALAGKLIRDLDKPKSEVVVDVYIMEANSTRTRDLAATLASAGTAGLNLSGAFTPRGVTVPSTNGTGGTGTGTTTTPASSSPVATLQQLGHLSSADFSANLPGALLQAMLSDNRTKLINNPQVRASDGQKVQLKIGDQVPIATGSFQSAVGTVGGLPSANTQFSFKDVGIKVELTPTVHSAEELTLHVLIEVSTVKSFVNVGGVSLPLIGTRNNETEIRLREGEVSLLGGLDGTQDSTTVNGIPGLVNIPILGKIFFGSNHSENDRQQLMIALVPHIVRTPDYNRENLRGVLSGVDQTVKMSYNAPAGVADATANPTATPAANPSVNPGAAAPPPAAQPQTAPVVARVTFAPGSITAPPNGPFTVNVQIEGASDAQAVTPLRVKWDPAVLRLSDIAPGDLLSRNNGVLNSVKDIRNDAGEATLTMSRAAGASGVSGSGAVATLNFVAIGRGSASVTVTEMGLKNSQGQTVPVTLGGVQVAVQ